MATRNPMNGVTEYRLQVLAGPQAGASIDLQPARKQTIATSLGADIVLFDDSSDQQLEIVAGKSGVVLCLTSGEAMCDNQAMTQGQRYSVPVNTPVTLGASTFTVVDSHTEPTSVELTDATIAQQATSQSKATNRWRAPVFACVGLGLVLVASVFFIQPPSVNDTESLAELDLSQELHRMDLGWVNVQQDDSGRQVFTGYVNDADELQRLNDMVVDRELSADIDVAVVDELHEAVASIYRINGIEAEIINGTPGSFIVKTQVADTSLLDRVEEGVRTDVPKLGSMRRENNAPPADIVADRNDESYREDPSKRVTMVVAGNPSYVVTQDSARYFIGSLLPSGHKILSIADNRVVLEKHGANTTLDF